MGKRKKIDGVLLLDKPAGISSNQALQQARWLYQAEKAGHGGTLDPFATGLLPVLFGEASKFGRYFLDGDKAYEATLAFGTETDTGDLSGAVIREAAPMKHGTTVIAFVEDPDGYKIEFIEKGTGADTYKGA